MGKEEYIYADAPIVVIRGGISLSFALCTMRGKNEYVAVLSYYYPMVSPEEGRLHVLVEAGWFTSEKDALLGGLDYCKSTGLNGDTAFKLRAMIEARYING